MQVRGLVQRQVVGVRLVFERGKKAGKQVSRIANLWGNSVVVDGCMVGSRSVLALRRGCVRLCEHYTCFATRDAVNRSIHAAMQCLHGAYGNASKTLHPRAARVWVSHDLNIEEYTFGLLKSRTIG
jgi:hypothetical protein